MENPPDRVAIEDRKAAGQQRRKEIVLITHAQAVDQTMSMAKWLLGSLLALNGGSILAILNGELMSRTGIPWAAALFALSIVSALVAAIIILRNGMQATIEMEDLLLKGAFGTGTFRKSDARIQASARKALGAGYAALFCLIMGMAVTGWALID